MHPYFTMGTNISSRRLRWENHCCSLPFDEIIWGGGTSFVEILRVIYIAERAVIMLCCKMIKTL